MLLQVDSPMSSSRNVTGAPSCSTICVGSSDGSFRVMRSSTARKNQRTRKTVTSVTPMPIAIANRFCCSRWNHSALLCPSVRKKPNPSSMLSIFVMSGSSAGIIGSATAAKWCINRLNMKTFPNCCF